MTDIKHTRKPLDIDTWFSLSYSNYLVLQRSILQSMPVDWQYRFTAIIDEMNDRMGEEMKARMPSSYCVRVLAREREWVRPECERCDGEGTELDEDDVIDDCPVCNGSGVDYDGPLRQETAEEVGFVDDPIPHYNRTRTRIDFETGREVRYV